MSDSKPTQNLPRPVKTYHTQTYDRIAVQHGFEAKGKTILITGGGKTTATGIGYAISSAFAKVGVKRVAIVARSLAPLEKAKIELEAKYPQTEVLTYSASVNDHAKIRGILAELGEIDVLIMNAAAFHPLLAVNDLTTEIMSNTFETNVIGPFELVKEFLKLPGSTSDRKTVLNVSTATALSNFPGTAAYAASKQSISFLLQHFAAQEAVKPVEEQVRFISFHPGVIASETAESIIPAGAVEWEDINLPADFSLWLAGSESAFLQGRIVWAQWDVDELIALKERVEKDPTFLTIGLVQ